MYVRRNQRPLPACCTRLRCAGATLLLLVLAGCQTPGAAAPPGSTIPAPPPGSVSDDIVAIMQYHAAEPWLRDEEGRVTGITARVYFLAARPGRGDFKGYFVPSAFSAGVYAMLRRTDGTYARELAYEWHFDPALAAAFRVTKPSLMGESYALPLRWPAELNLMGREIQIEVRYQRRDGNMVVKRGSRFRVPVPSGPIAEPPRAAAPAPAASRPARTRPAPRTLPAPAESP